MRKIWRCLLSRNRWNVCFLDASCHLYEWEKQLACLCTACCRILHYWNKRLTKDSIVILSSVTGTTQEVVKAVEQIKKVGATLIGFIDKANSKLSQLCDFVVTYPAPGTEQIKFLWQQIDWCIWMENSKLIQNTMNSSNVIYQQG